MRSAPETYHLHGVVVRSEIALPLVPVVAAGEPHVVVRHDAGSAPHGAVRHTRTDGEQPPSVVERWYGDDLEVSFSSGVSFVVAVDQVTLTAEPTGDPDLVAHLLLDHVLPRVLALQGDLVLHAAGAVSPAGRAHLFLGPSGSGKSTLVTSLGTRGWTVLDDDAVRVTRGPAGPAVHPGYPGVRLWPESAEALSASLEPAGGLSATENKARFRLIASAAVDGPVPIAGTCLLDWSEGGDAGLAPVGFAEGVAALVEYGFHLAEEPAAISRRAFDHAVTLASAVPAWRLTRPHDLDRLEAVAELLDQHDARF